MLFVNGGAQQLSGKCVRDGLVPAERSGAGEPAVPAELLLRQWAVLRDSARQVNEEDACGDDAVD